MRTNQLVSLIIGGIFISISIYLAINLVEVSKNLMTKISLGWVSSTIISRLLVCLAFARGLQLIIKSFNLKLNGILVFVLGFIVGFGLSFLSPIYEGDYGHYGTEDQSINHQQLSEITNGKYQIKNEPYLVAFFTTNCPHCKEACQKLGFSSQLDRLPPAIAIFPGNEDNTKTFLEQNNGQFFEYYRLDNNEQFFIENSGAAFPSIFLINEKGETVKHWFGDLLNYSALDYLGSLK